MVLNIILAGRYSCAISNVELVSNPIAYELEYDVHFGISIRALRTEGIDTNVSSEIKDLGVSRWDIYVRASHRALI